MLLKDLIESCFGKNCEQKTGLVNLLKNKLFIHSDQQKSQCKGGNTNQLMIDFPFCRDHTIRVPRLNQLKNRTIILKRIKIISKTKEHMQNNSTNKFIGLKNSWAKIKNLTYLHLKIYSYCQHNAKLITLKQMIVILFIWNHSY